MKLHRVRLGYEAKIGNHAVLLRKLPRVRDMRYWIVEVDGAVRGRYAGLKRAKAAVAFWAQP